MTAPQLASAYLLDLIAGDPEWFPHPVRLFGSLIHAGERLLRPVGIGSKRELLAGGVLTTSVVSVGWALGRPGNPIWRVMMTWTALATHSLLKEAVAVITALEANDIGLARKRAARIVGRDTSDLDETEIARAVIETLAESACDGIVAPLFWLAVAGLHSAMAYKAINTLDSMIGHPERPYRYFGRIAARFDDVANFIPARLTAICISVAAYFLNLDAGSAWRVWLQDGNLHASPNAGQSEAAMAGALSVRLGGVNVYAGLPHTAPVLNAEGSAASVCKARAAVSVVALVSVLAFVGAMLVISVRRRR